MNPKWPVRKLAEASTSSKSWASYAPLLQRVLDPGAYPLASRVGTAAGAAFSPEHAYEFGLRTVLDGLEALITRQR